MASLAVLSGGAGIANAQTPGETRQAPAAINQVRSPGDEGFDFVDLADALDDRRITSPAALADALRADGACGAYRDGYEGREPERVCALLLNVFENAQGYWYVARAPVFALEADSTLRHSRPPPRSVLGLTTKAGRTVVGIAPIASLLPGRGPVKFPGSDDSWSWSHTLVVGKQANLDLALGIPETFFDPTRYRNRPPG